MKKGPKGPQGMQGKKLNFKIIEIALIAFVVGILIGFFKRVVETFLSLFLYPK